MVASRRGSQTVSGLKLRRVATRRAAPRTPSHSIIDQGDPQSRSPQECSSREGHYAASSLGK
ncbi:hypothetical protein E2C01_004705 [Portunus trituberculatus]|uniref:Uncharacterized protein n=1 Tax=Portunus trituberculatus TaxID=210409 RepID=A0A5B7CSE1_PORTR|nr:hypothetical protein [Portunus trituberculatus]